MFTNTLFTTQTMADVKRADAEFQTNWRRLVAERALDAARTSSRPATRRPGHRLRRQGRGEPGAACSSILDFIGAARGGS